MRSQKEIEEQIRALVRDQRRVGKLMIAGPSAPHLFEDFTLFQWMIRQLLWVLEKDDSYVHTLESEDGVCQS